MLLQAYQQHYSPWLIHILFLIGVHASMWVGYKTGKWLQRRYKDSQFVAYAQKKATIFEEYLGKRCLRFALILLGIINPASVNAFFLSWLPIRFKSMYGYLIFGVLVWYVLEWMVVIGISTFVTGSYITIYALLIAAVLISVAAKHIHKRIKKRHAHTNPPR